MAEFAYNKLKNASTGHIFLGSTIDTIQVYYLRMMSIPVQGLAQLRK